MAYNNNDKNNNLYQCGTKSSPESRGGTPATWSLVEDVGLSKPKGNVWNILVHHTRTSFGEVWQGQNLLGEELDFGAEQESNLIPSEAVWVDSTWKCKAVGKRDRSSNRSLDRDFPAHK